MDDYVFDKPASKSLSVCAYRGMKIFLLVTTIVLATIQQSAGEEVFEDINRWQDCVSSAVERFAVGTTEPAETLLKGAYALCRQEELRYFAYLQKTASDGPFLKFEAISSHLRETFEGDFIAVALTARAKS